MKTTQHPQVFFASDFHLGAKSSLSSPERERIIIAWLSEIRDHAHTIYLVGDIFDYWFEYRHVVPKGFTRLFGILGSMVDQGINIHFIKGNHDMWVYTYFQQELGIKVHNTGIQHEIDGYQFYITHGDGIGKGDIKYKFIKGLLRNHFAQRAFAMVHPGIGIPIMKYMSRLSRNGHDAEDIQLQLKQKEVAEQMSLEHKISYFICGHTHRPELTLLKNKISYFCNLGDWLTSYTYAAWDGNSLKLVEYAKD